MSTRDMRAMRLAIRIENQIVDAICEGNAKPLMRNWQRWNHLRRSVYPGEHYFTPGELLDRVIEHARFERSL